MENMPYMLKQALEYYMRENGVKNFSISERNQPVISIRFKSSRDMAAALAGGLLPAESYETFHSSNSTRFARNRQRSENFKRRYNTRSGTKSNDIEQPRCSENLMSDYGLYHMSSLSPEAPEFQPQQHVSPLIEASSPEPAFLSTPAIVSTHSRHIAQHTESLPQSSVTGSVVTHDLLPSDETHSSDASDDIGVMDLFSSAGIICSDGYESSSDEGSYEFSTSDAASYYQPVLCPRTDLYHSSLSLEVPICNWISSPVKRAYVTCTRGKNFYEGMTCTFCDVNQAHRDILCWDKNETYTWRYFCSINCRNRWQKDVRWPGELIE